MPKYVKYLAIALAAMIALLVTAGAIIAATFDPNDYKPRIIRLVQEKKQRTLTIPGDIKLTFFPKIGADLGKVSLSEHKSEAEFASLDSARISLALMPLLSKQLVVDQVRLDGLRAHIRRNKDGTTNFDDLLADGKEQPQAQPDNKPAEPVNFNIDGIEVTNARIVYEDRQQASRFELADLNLGTGRIADGVPSDLRFSSNVTGNKPAINARVDMKTGFTMDLGARHYTLKGLDAQVKGKIADFTDVVLKAAGDADLQPERKRFAVNGMVLNVSAKRAAQALSARLDAPKLSITDAAVTGGKLSGDAKLTEGPRTVSAQFGAPSFEGSPQAFRVPSIGIDLAVKEDKLDAKAKIAGALSGNIDKMLFSSPQLSLNLTGRQGDTALDGTLTTPVSIDLKNNLIELANIGAAFTLPNPAGGSLNFKAAGNAGADLGKQKVDAALKGTLDQSAFDAKLGLAKFSPAAYTFNIGIDQIDLDRYKAKPAGASPQAPASKPAPPEQPLDLSALRNLQASGSVRIGSLKAANIRMSNARFDLRAAGGTLEISPLVANLYGGSASGSLSVAATNPPRIALRQNLAGINVGPLLKDAMAKDPIEGKGNVQLDIAAAGATVTQMKKALSGSARLELRDGAIRGVNVAEVIRNAKAKIGALRGTEAAQTGTGSAAEKTDFSELAGSFRIAGGVARNDDLILKSPLLRIGGNGDVNIGEDRLDYLVRATVVSTLRGQGGPEMQAMKGLTVPVRLSGPFANIGWRVDVAGMAGELARQKIDERKDEVRSRAEKALEEQKNKVEDRVREQFKGLFGK